MKETLMKLVNEPPSHANIANILHFLLQEADPPLGVFSGDVERSGQGSGHRADLVQVRQAEGHRLQGVHRQIQLVVQHRVTGSRCRTLQIGDRLNEGMRKVQRENYISITTHGFTSSILW